MIKNSSKAKEKFDIIQLILSDHKPLKALIKTMKGEKPSYAQKKAAFEKFAPTLIAHAKPEEYTWYKYMKSEKDSKVDGIEGEIEHGLADQLCEELKRTANHRTFMAKVKVLAELVEHHIEEEEEDMLPAFKKESSLEERLVLGAKYIKIQEAFIAHGGDDAPREKSVAFEQMEATH